MLLNAYSIYDRKALQYHPPFYASTDGAASRSLSDLVADAQTSVGRHPTDYVLYCVGQYDDAKGQLLPLSPLRHVVDAAAFIPPRSPDLFEDRLAATDANQDIHKHARRALEIAKNGGL